MRPSFHISIPQSYQSFNSPKNHHLINNRIISPFSLQQNQPLHLSPSVITPFSPRNTNIPTSPHKLLSPHKLQHINTIIQKNNKQGGLYIGDTVCTLQISILTNNNIQSIICCNSQANQIKNKLGPNFPNKLNYKHIDIQDHPQFPINKYFQQCYQYIQKQRSLGRNVLIQCHGGVSRSGTILCAYLLKKTNNKLNDVYEFVTKIRKRIKPNSGFWKQLVEYQKILVNKQENYDKQRQGNNNQGIKDNTKINQTINMSVTMNMNMNMSISTGMNTNMYITNPNNILKTKNNQLNINTNILKQPNKYINYKNINTININNNNNNNNCNKLLQNISYLSPKINKNKRNQSFYNHSVVFYSPLH